MSAANIRRQLDIEQRLFGYVYSADPSLNDRAANALAQSLAGMGVEDIREIAFYRGVASYQYMVLQSFYSGEQGEVSMEVPQQVQTAVGWFYNTRTNARLGGGIEGAVGTSYYQGDQEIRVPLDQALAERAALVNAPVILISNNHIGDRWNADFGVRFMPDGLPLFIPHVWRDDSAWQTIRAAVTFWLTAVSFIVPGVGAVIGSAVFGAEIAAAYPTLVSLATNTALKTALNGGDVAAAVTQSLAGLVGAGFGDIVGTNLDAAVIGKLTGAATTAAINGTDIKQAVGMALLSAGASGALAPTSTTAAPAPQIGVDMDDDFGDFSNAVNLFPPTDASDVSVFPSSTDYAFDVGQPGAVDPSGFQQLGNNYVFPLDDQGTMVQPGSVSPFDPGPPNATDDWNWGDILKNVSQTAIAALQVVKAYQNSNSPPVRTALPSQTVNKNGTISTTSPTGQVQVARPPAGQPYTTGDGYIVMNNGDGTYTVISPSGAKQTYPYTTAPGSNVLAFPTSMSADTQKLLLYGALGLGAFFVFRSMRRG